MLMRYFAIVGLVLVSGLIAQSAKTASFEILQSGFEKLGAAYEIKNTKPLKSKQLRDEGVKILKDELKPGTIIRSTPECPFKKPNAFSFELSCVRHDHNEYVPVFMIVSINYEGLFNGVISTAQHPFTPRAVVEQFEEIGMNDIFQGEVEVVQSGGGLLPSTFTEVHDNLLVIGRLKSIDKTP